MTKDLILGTAGHIDHGKTTLIKALTGVDTDRLPEEKRRGITIELGFAELTVDGYRLGIVDVPGHEKFVRQMLAGATGMDLAMLVVAADDSVKPQTREHLDVLRILDLPAGVIALTKCDTAEAEWIGLVEEEVRELVQGTFLADAPMIRTSAMTGMGVDELKAALAAAAQRAAEHPQRQRAAGPFRMAIDRGFTIAGHGTVVTGSVSSGQVRVGDQLVIEPGAVAVRVRGLQNHDRVVEHVLRGQRAAINLAGVHHQEVTRGHELLTPGFLTPSRLLTVSLAMLPEAARPLKHRSRVRLHLGTAEVLATVVLLEGDQLTAGQRGLAQLFLAEPVVSTWNQPFVLRSESPVETIAGGRVLVPAAHKLRRPDQPTLARLRRLESDDPLERASAAIYFAGAEMLDPDALVATAGITDPAAIFQQLLEQGTVRELELPGQRKIYLHQQLIDDYSQRIAAVLERLHQENALASVFDRSRIASQFAYLGHAAVFDAILAQMQNQGQVRLTSKGMGLAARGPKLSRGEQELLGQLVQLYRQAEFQPPSVKECQQQATRHQKSVPQLLALAAAEGDLVEISQDYYLHAEVEQQLRETMQQALTDRPGMTLSEIRELLQTTRKYAVPICEYLDRIGFTRRQGDLRVLDAVSVGEAK